MAQIFIALDGKVKIAGPNGQRTIAVEELFLDFYTTSLAEDEILTQVVLPPLPARSGIEYIRFSSSSVVDKPCAGVAVRLTVNADATIQTARIVLGCVGATPVRARKAEALIAGKNLTAELAEEAGSIASQECSPTSDLRGSEKYKRAIVGDAGEARGGESVRKSPHPALSLRARVGEWKTTKIYWNKLRLATDMNTSLSEFKFGNPIPSPACGRGQG